MSADGADLGAAWKKTSGDNSESLSMKLDDISFGEPADAALAAVDGEPTLARSGSAKAGWGPRDAPPGRPAHREAWLDVAQAEQGNGAGAGQERFQSMPEPFAPPPHPDPVPPSELPSEPPPEIDDPIVPFEEPGPPSAPDDDRPYDPPPRVQ